MRKISVFMIAVVLTLCTPCFAVQKIGTVQAKAIAVKIVDQEQVGTITEVGLEREGGILVYVVEFTKERVETDAKRSGVKIVSGLDELKEEPKNR